MATVDYDASNEFCIGESTEDLEKTLVLAAADADARRTEIQHDLSPEPDCEPKVSYLRDSTSGSGLQNVGTKRKLEPEEDVPYLRDISGGSGVQKGGIERRLEPDDESVSKVQRYDVKTFAECHGHAKVVATHYNSLEEKGLDERSKSRIVYMRNFHNWLKSMLINEYLTKIKDAKKHNAPVRVHDMCCGKGGDLLKWKKGNITHLICSDIASVSLDQCRSRYEDMKGRSQRERNSGNLYSIEYIAADCTRVRLRERYKDPSVKLDLVSCQFAFHYSFESLPQAECMMKNAAECLQPGGFFIGTMPDANELMARLKKSQSGMFGNNVFYVTMDGDQNKPAFFGAKYNFHLDGVVDCPEFLVYFPLFVKLAKKYGLKLVRSEKFCDFYERMKSEGRTLLTNMRSLETYPPYEGSKLVGDATDDYNHAKEFLEKVNKDTNARLGTLSKSEWEASSLYLSFVFEKVKNTWNASGDPVYDI